MVFKAIQKLSLPYTIIILLFNFLSKKDTQKI